MSEAIQLKNDTNTPTETITGVLERIIYSNEETQYCIGELIIRDNTNPITIAGTLPNVQCGETLTINGYWIHHPQYGKQFKPVDFKSKLPATVHGIRKYLGSGLIQGIGKTYANKIVDYFGEDTLKVISEESAKLKDVPGIGKQRAKSIKAAWDKQQAVRDVIMFLKTYGVSSSQCLKLVKRYGNLAKDILQNEPYKVAQEIHGIGFSTADKIALNLGFPTDSPTRLDAGILHTFSEFESKGHTACTKKMIQDNAAEILNVDPTKVSDRIEVLIEENHIIKNEESLLQSPDLNRAENSIAKCINKLNESASYIPTIDIDKAVDWAQNNAGFEFAPEQIFGIKSALKEKLSIITGGPGTGKTTLLQALVKILRAKHVRLVLAAPTGRAAQRMSETTGIGAQTIHRLLKFNHEKKKFTYNEDNTLDLDYIIIDESSMIDTRLAASLLKAIPKHAHLLLVGDINQLPSVGSGKILEDFIQCGLFTTTTLNQIFRQGKRSNIVSTAHAILKGQIALPPIKKTSKDIDINDDLHFVKASTPEECLERISLLCKKYIPQWYQIESQVLTPLHRGICGTKNINTKLQEVLNKQIQDQPTTINSLKPGDKVIQTCNNYDKGIFNGDLGIVIAYNSSDGILTVEFDSGSVELDKADITDLQLAYAISIHKSQGSEFPIVIIPILKQHFIMLQRNLLYTAITRGRKKVFLVGDPAAYAIAVNNKESALRLTDLTRKIKSTNSK